MNANKKTCRKVIKTNRKAIRKPTSKTSVPSKWICLIYTESIPKTSYMKSTKTSSISDRRYSKKSLVTKIAETKRNKVMK